MTAFLKPMFSNAIFHAKTPSFIANLNSLGTVFSIQNIIGVIGSVNKVVVLLPGTVGNFFVEV